MARTAEITREDKATESQPAETHAHEGAGLHLHTRTLHPPVPIPYFTREDVRSTTQSATARLPGRPSGKDLVFYGGLGALAVAGALEWPVALAVGGATWLVRGRGRETQEARGPREPREETTETQVEREPRGDTRARGTTRKNT
ncbi:hypothetical protein ACFS5L_39895 [Streptomyces phyllanthi]|uniref:Uncharacterized protein n=1 Tax=Streptomyces phyllanthi TaxID=1803180 RepID=A0A5N8WBM6_9ACTN|nr:hypothetical protein [Streptomyces phyllanthi]MPY44871.1 hypothetical protein [Streptomyces phyllanthi]